MSTLQEKVKSLQCTSCRLLSLGEQSEDIYADDLFRLDKEVVDLTASLFGKKGTTLEEEASLCLALLMGYSACMYVAHRERKVQSVLNRCWNILDKLPASFLKCRLLVFCYGETYEEELAEEAYTIMKDWGGSDLTEEKQEMKEYLKALRECAYPHGEVIR